MNYPQILTLSFWWEMPLHFCYPGSKSTFQYFRSKRDKIIRFSRVVSGLHKPDWRGSLLLRMLLSCLYVLLLMLRRRQIAPESKFNFQQFQSKRTSTNFMNYIFCKRTFRTTFIYCSLYFCRKHLFAFLLSW